MASLSLILLLTLYLGQVHSQVRIQHSVSVINVHIDVYILINITLSDC